MREWLLETVAPEIALRGLGKINLEQLAAVGDVDIRQAREAFPDRRALMAAVVSAIVDAQTEYIYKYFKPGDAARARLVHLIARSLDFIDNHPNLAEIIVVALLGNDAELREQVHEAYGGLFQGLLEDLLAEGIITNPTPMTLSDLYEVLLSVIFLGGCPRLQMDYLSFVNPDSVALSTLEAMKRRYAIFQVE